MIKYLVIEKYSLNFISEDFILYRKINYNHYLSKKSYILLGYYLLELEITFDEPFFSRNPNKNPNKDNSKKKL